MAVGAPSFSFAGIGETPKSSALFANEPRQRFQNFCDSLRHVFRCDWALFERYRRVRDVVIVDIANLCSIIGCCRSNHGFNFIGDN